MRSPVRIWIAAPAQDTSKPEGFGVFLFCPLSLASLASSPKGGAAGVCKNNKNRAAGNVRTCGAVYLLEEIVLVENGFLSQFSKIVPIKIAYLRYAVCGCCLCIKNANCYKNDAGEAMQPLKIGFSKKKSTVLPAKYSAFLVENSGIEPLTSCMPCKRSPEPP